MASIKVGDRAPNFSLPSQSGATVSLNDFLGKKCVVLYFYPKDDTPGCTAESCAFRDRYEVFQEAGAEVIGISADSPNSHQQFASKYQLPFTLLSDQSNQVRKSYGVPATLFILPGRVTYVIDKEGIVRHIFDSQLDFKAHVEEALNTLAKISD
jgi:peroxiredoxin Q/BCP